jgi:N-glycosylase/DNA lyase
MTANNQLRASYEKKRSDIEKRLKDFRRAYEMDDDHVFGELAFCLLTPQTKAKSAWRTIEKLKEKDLLLRGGAGDIKKWMASVRFNNNKSEYIVLARDFFSDDGKMRIKERIDDMKNPMTTRKWLIDNVKGMGYKEASHFLRNVGFGEDIAILDRHILKHLLKNNVIDEIPKSITDKKYLEIEQKMREFSKRVDIPMAHLDLLWWSEETGEIFK